MPWYSNYHFNNTASLFLVFSRYKRVLWPPLWYLKSILLPLWTVVYSVELHYWNNTRRNNRFYDWTGNFCHFKYWLHSVYQHSLAEQLFPYVFFWTTISSKREDQLVDYWTERFNVWQLTSTFFLIAGCSLGYKMSLYPQFKHLNSQIAEQKNSKLARIKSQLSYMNPSNFMRHAKLFLWHHNKKRIASLTS